MLRGHLRIKFGDKTVSQQQHSTPRGYANTSNLDRPTIALLRHPSPLLTTIVSANYRFTAGYRVEGSQTIIITTQNYDIIVALVSSPLSIQLNKVHCNTNVI